MTFIYSIPRYSFKKKILTDYVYNIPLVRGSFDRNNKMLSLVFMGFFYLSRFKCIAHKPHADRRNNKIK